MNMPMPVARYLARHAQTGGRTLVGGACSGIDQAVVIPALAEKEGLPEVLLSLSANEPDALSRTLVVIVINNRREGISAAKDIENNRQTMSFLSALMRKDAVAAAAISGKDAGMIRKILDSRLQLAYIDASSLTMEMPEKGGGVGTARKLGLDVALGIMDYRLPTKKLLFNLDADTWVEPNYLSAVRCFFEKHTCGAAVVAYAHRPQADHDLQAAICCYEIYLRYYVTGLRYAGSPYAFDCIGSTIVSTEQSYVAVHGMNRREAAEDFYFLDKLAKFAGVGRICTTTVYPSGRPSRRVPFGTGRSVIRFLEGKQNEYLLYDQQVFSILKRWLDVMTAGNVLELPDIMVAAGDIHPQLVCFLKRNRFEEAWRSICNNHRERDALKRQFHVWFDGFRTMKLVHHLTEAAFARRDMFEALACLLEMMNTRCPAALNSRTREDQVAQLEVLNFLRQFTEPICP